MQNALQILFDHVESHTSPHLRVMTFSFPAATDHLLEQISMWPVASFCGDHRDYCNRGPTQAYSSHCFNRFIRTPPKKEMGSFFSLVWWFGMLWWDCMIPFFGVVTILSNIFKHDVLSKTPKTPIQGITILYSNIFLSWMGCYTIQGVKTPPFKPDESC